MNKKESREYIDYVNDVLDESSKLEAKLSTDEARQPVSCLKKLVYSLLMLHYGRHDYAKEYAMEAGDIVGIDCPEDW